MLKTPYPKPPGSVKTHLEPTAIKGERARAVSKRFVVPDEPGRDVLGTLRLWKPSRH